MVFARARFSLLFLQKFLQAGTPEVPQDIRAGIHDPYILSRSGRRKKVPDLQFRTGAQMFSAFALQAARLIKKEKAVRYNSQNRQSRPFTRRLDLFFAIISAKLPYGSVLPET